MPVKFLYNFNLSFVIYSLKAFFFFVCFRKTKKDIIACLELYRNNPSITLERDITSNLEMLEIFDPFLAKKLKYHNPELNDIKEKVHDREKVCY